MAEVRDDNTRVVKLFSGYKKNFHIMQHKFTQLSDFIKDVRFRINLKEDVQRREYAHMSNMINFDKKNKPGFYDGVYSNQIIKNGLDAQLKDYIEGKITADQLFKRRVNQNNTNTNHNKSYGNENMTQNNLTNINNNIKEEETKFNIIDLFKESIKAKGFPENKQKNTHTKEIIKEEEETNTSNYELNSIFNKTTKEKSIMRNNSTFKLEEKKNETRHENTSQKKEKEIIIKPKNEDEKIKIISIDKDKDKDNNSENKVIKTFEKKSSMKNAITNLFNVKHIMDNIRKEPNDNQANDIKKDSKKNERPMTTTTNKRATVDNNPLKSNASNLGPIIKEEIEIISNKNKNASISENKREVPEKKGKENMYNKTMNSLGQNYPPLTANVINKKSSTSNKKNVKYYVKTNKENKENIVNKGNRAFSGIKTDETKRFENLFNNLKSYIPKNDINMEGHSLLKKK